MLNHKEMSNDVYVKGFFNLLEFQVGRAALGVKEPGSYPCPAENGVWGVEEGGEGVRSFLDCGLFGEIEMGEVEA